MAHGHGQRTDVIMMTMGKRYRIHVLVLDGIEHRQSGAPLALGMSPGVHQQAMAFEIDEPGAGADVGVRVEIDDSHRWRNRSVVGVRREKGMGRCRQAWRQGMEAASYFGVASAVSFFTI